MQKVIAVLLLCLIPAIVFSEITCEVTRKYEDIKYDYELPKEVSYYKDGVGIAKEFYDKKGNIIKRDGNIPDGVVKEYGQQNIEWVFKNNRLEGVAKQYYKTGKLCWEISYKNNKRDGISKEYSEYDKIRSEENWKNGKLDGFQKIYYENGTIYIERNYKNGELEGVCKTYYWNGELESEITYKNGNSEGIAKKYAENGKLLAEISLKNNRLEGVYRIYNEDGVLLYLDNYKNNQKVSRKAYDRKGNLIYYKDYPYDTTKDGVRQKGSNSVPVLLHGN